MADAPQADDALAAFLATIPDDRDADSAVLRVGGAVDPATGKPRFALLPKTVPDVCEWERQAQWTQQVYQPAVSAGLTGKNLPPPEPPQDWTPDPDWQPPQSKAASTEPGSDIVVKELRR